MFWPGRRLGSEVVDYDLSLDLCSFRKNYLRPTLAAEGLQEMRSHDFRHTYPSLMLDAGYEQRKVSHRIGHASLNTTDTIYVHLYPVDNEPEIARIDV